MNSRIRRRLGVGFYRNGNFWPGQDFHRGRRPSSVRSEKNTWHAGFDRYDFIMDDATGQSLQ